MFKELGVNWNVGGGVDSRLSAGASGCSSGSGGGGGGDSGGVAVLRCAIARSPTWGCVRTPGLRRRCGSVLDVCKATDISQDKNSRIEEAHLLVLLAIFICHSRVQ